MEYYFKIEDATLLIIILCFYANSSPRVVICFQWCSELLAVTHFKMISR